jgi:hypothetical protein
MFPEQHAVESNRELAGCRAYSDYMHRDCSECRRLWERYYHAVVAEFLWQERPDAGSRLSTVQITVTQADAEAAFATVAAVRAELAAHQRLHDELSERHLEGII